MEQSPKNAAAKLSVVILAALGLGIVFGALVNLFLPSRIELLDRYFLVPAGKVFLRLIQFVVVPIVFSSLILGLTRVRDASQVGRYAIKLIVSYIMTNLVAVSLGVSLALLLKPGAEMTGVTLAAISRMENHPSMLDWLIGLIPINPLEALSTGNLLQTIFSAALFGIGIQLAGERATSFVAFIDSTYVISEKILSVILYAAPLGVFALIASVIATQGFGIISRLFIYILGVLTGFAIMTLIYTLILLLLKAKPGEFFRSFFPTFSFSFGTASSNAALPIALQNAEEAYGMPEEIASFAIPLGTALKHDGSAIYQSFNALFIAQVYHIPLTPSLVFAIALSTFLVSFSTAGVPGSGIIMMTTVLSAAGLPLEGVALVAGIDRLTDGFKTTLNVLSNLANAAILACWEREQSETPQPVPQLQSDES